MKSTDATARKFNAGFDSTVSSVMVRDLKGEIKYWNRASEKRYGWASDRAIGTVSHRLLNTVFPEPLDEINSELLERGAWEGYLLHTLSDGSRVKVLSRWELIREREEGTCVVEVNDQFSPVTPDSAHLLKVGSLPHRVLRLLAKEKLWWIIPALFTLLLVEIILELTADRGSMPFILP